MPWPEQLLGRHFTSRTQRLRERRGRGGDTLAEALTSGSQVGHANVRSPCRLPPPSSRAAAGAEYPAGHAWDTGTQSPVSGLGVGSVLTESLWGFRAAASG